LGIIRRVDLAYVTFGSIWMVASDQIWLIVSQFATREHIMNGFWLA